MYSNFYLRPTQKLKDFANKHQGEHISSFFKPYIPFNSLVNMVDCEDITSETFKLQELSLEINTHFDSKTLLIKETLPNLHNYTQYIQIPNLNLNDKKIFFLSLIKPLSI